MRHLGSFLLAVVLAPIVYLLTGVGLSAFSQATTRGVAERPMASMLSIATLAVAGAVYAVLVMARLSPIGPALAGFFFLSMPAWPLVDPTSYADALNTVDARFKILGVEILGIDLVGRSGVGVLLAIPLIATLASPRRWSRYATAPGAEVAYYGQTTGFQQPYAYAGPTRPIDPVTEQLPDVSPPTLHYPRSSAAAAPAPVRPAEPPAPPTVVLPVSPAVPPAPVAAPAVPPAPIAAPAAASVAAPAPTPAPSAGPRPAPEKATPPKDATSLIAPEPPKAEAPEPPKAEAPEPPEPPKQPEPLNAKATGADVPDADATVRLDPDTVKPN